MRRAIKSAQLHNRFFLKFSQHELLNVSRQVKYTEEKPVLPFYDLYLSRTCYCVISSFKLA